MLKIDYESEGFPPGPVTNGLGVLDTTWAELLWAAVTVGRPNRNYVFMHGDASRYEAIFRWSLVRMALEQGGPRAFRIRRTNAAKTLDPTEKGAVNYFLGLIFCKLFAARLLDAPWALHLDVFGSQVGAVLTSRSRPDLIAQTGAGEWVSLEAKGRVSPPSLDAKTKAKSQALRIVSVGGFTPRWHVGGITYFYGDALKFYWQDPPADQQDHRNGIKISVNPKVLRHYYAPVLELLLPRIRHAEQPSQEDELHAIEEADLAIGVHPQVMRYLRHEEWGKAKEVAIMLQDELAASGYRPDGVKLVAGESWLERAKSMHEG